MRLLLLPTLSLLAAPLGAQTLTPSLPRCFAGWDAPEDNWLPLGRTRGFLQTWYHGSNLAMSKIAEIGWRLDARAIAPATTHVLEITLANTKKAFSDLSTTFANNLGAAPVVFVKLRSMVFPALTGRQGPNTPSLWIKGDQPFVFTGPNLVVQVDIRSDHRFGYISNYKTDSYFFEQPIHGTTGKGCARASLAASVESGRWTVDMRDLPAQGVGIFLIGFDHLFATGGVPLPLDLTAFGMKGCSLNIDTTLVRARVADGKGTARFQLPIPRLPIPLTVHAQGVELVTSNSAGLATTNAVHSVLSKEYLSTYLFNWQRDGPVAEFGPYSNNVGQVLLVR